MAALTSGLLTTVRTGITIVSYFGNVTASLFALKNLENLCLGDTKQYRQTVSLYCVVHGLVLSLQTNSQSECDNSFSTYEMSIYKYAQ